jgi:hypothetical protein
MAASDKNWKASSKIGFAGVVASGQPDHVVQMIQFDPFDAAVIGDRRNASV